MKFKPYNKHRPKGRFTKFCKKFWWERLILCNLINRKSNNSGKQKCAKSINFFKFISETSRNFVILIIENDTTKKFYVF